MAQQQKHFRSKRESLRLRTAVEPSRSRLQPVELIERKVGALPALIGLAAPDSVGKPMDGRIAAVLSDGRRAPEERHSDRPRLLHGSQSTPRSAIVWQVERLGIEHAENSMRMKVGLPAALGAKALLVVTLRTGRTALPLHAQVCCGETEAENSDLGRCDLRVELPAGWSE